MADRMSVKVTGVADVVRAFEKVLPIRAQRNATLRTMTKAAQPIVQGAKARAPSRSGALAMSIGLRNESASKSKKGNRFARKLLGPIRKDRKAIVAYHSYYHKRGVSAQQIQAGIRHGHLVEFGTKKMPRHPFLRPAADAGFPGYVREFAGILRRELERDAAKLYARRRT